MYSSLRRRSYIPLFCADICALAVAAVVTGTIVLRAATKDEAEAIFKMVDAHSKSLSASAASPPKASELDAAGVVTAPLPSAAGAGGRGVAAGGAGANNRARPAGSTSPGTARRETLAEAHRRLVGNAAAGGGGGGGDGGWVKEHLAPADEIPFPTMIEGGGGGGGGDSSGGADQAVFPAGAGGAGEDAYARLSTVSQRAPSSPFLPRKEKEASYTSRNGGSGGSAYSVLSPNRHTGGSNYEVLGSAGRTPPQPPLPVATHLARLPERYGSTYSILSPAQQQPVVVGSGSSEVPDYARANPEYATAEGASISSSPMYAYGDLASSHGSDATIYYSEIPDGDAEDGPDLPPPLPPPNAGR